MGELKVIGAGLGRTGTKSLKNALEILGLRCYHMMEVQGDDVIGQWGEALRRKLEDLRAGRETQVDDVVGLLDGFQATVDFPGCLFHEELQRRFPHAKVILTVREPQKWYQSIKFTIAHFAFSWSLNIMLLFAGSRRFWKLIGAQIWRVWGQEMGSGYKDVRAMLRDEALVLHMYQQYNEKVKRDTDPGNLLVYEVREGWEPLCKFLNLPVPNTPFPNVNDTNAFKKMRRTRLRKGLLPRLGCVLAIGVAVACAAPFVARSLRR